MKTSEEKQAALEALLFVAGEPLPLKKIALLLDISIEELSSLLKKYKEELHIDPKRGLMLIENNDFIELATKPTMTHFVETLVQSTFQETLSRATLETLSIIAYRAPISRSEIEVIRGVNCSYTLRTLLLRGLIEREGNSNDTRGYRYRPTTLFLEHLGLSRLADLPQYDLRSRDERMEILLKSTEPLQGERT